MTEREAPATLDALWYELTADALSSDGPISDRDVKDAIARWRPRIEAEASVPAHIHDSDKCDECYEIFEEALRD